MQCIVILFNPITLSCLLSLSPFFLTSPVSHLPLSLTTLLMSMGRWLLYRNINNLPMATLLKKKTLPPTTIINANDSYSGRGWAPPPPCWTAQGPSPVKALCRSPVAATCSWLPTPTSYPDDYFMALLIFILYRFWTGPP